MNGNKNIKKKNIAVFGTFDVDNYGDLLFPHIAEYRLKNYHLEFVSPTNYKTMFTDAKEVVTFEECKQRKYDGVLIGGGNILHLKNNSSTVYKNVQKGFSYADLWVGAVKLATNLKKPSLFNAPGISGKFKSTIQQQIAKATFGASSYIAFREGFSVNMAKDLFSEKEKIPEFNVVPDTALEINKIWPCDEPKTDKLVINLNPRYHQPVSETASLLVKIAKKLGCQIKFIIIGDCHGDGKFTKKVLEYIKIKGAEIVETKTLKEMAFEIATAKYFIGSSMHGFITALSYNTPAFLVLNNEPMHKFIGLYENCGLDQISICKSFSESMDKLEYPAVLKDENRKIILNKLDKHWSEVIRIIGSEQTTNGGSYVMNYEAILEEDFKKKKKVKKASGIVKVKNRIKKILGY